MAEGTTIDIPKLRRTVAVRFGLFAVLFAVALFVPAGTTDWWQAWLWMATWMVPALSFTAYYLKADPAMIERRMRSKEPEAEQRRIIRFGWVICIAAFILPGFDRRFGWSSATRSTPPACSSPRSARSRSAPGPRPPSPSSSSR